MVLAQCRSRYDRTVDSKRWRPTTTGTGHRSLALISPLVSTASRSPARRIHNPLLHPHPDTHLPAHTPAARSSHPVPCVAPCVRITVHHQLTLWRCPYRCAPSAGTVTLGNVPAGATAVRYLWYSAPCTNRLFRCPIYAVVPALGSLSGELDALPLGPFVADLT